MVSDFIRDSGGQIKIDEQDRFFVLWSQHHCADGCKTVITTRKMALGLLEYFLTHSDFQSKILAENSSAAEARLQTNDRRTIR